MADMINILVKKPGELWHRETIPNETYYLGDDHLIVCNEEGWLNNLPYNCEMDETQFCGTLIMCKQDGEEFASIW